MAELLIKVGGARSALKFQDGDPIDCFNARRIQCVHAAHLCHVKHAGTTSEGLRPAGSIAQAWNDATWAYRFERVSATEVDRVRLSDGHRDRFGPPKIKVQRFIDLRKRHPQHRVFGTSGAEFWYGGTRHYTSSDVSAVWDAIEASTIHQRTDAAFQRWPAGTQEKRSHLFVVTDDFTDDDALAIVASEDDTTDPDNPIVLAKRVQSCDWRDVLSLSARDVQDIEDRSIEVDIRERQAFDRSTILRTKTQAERRRR